MELDPLLVHVCASNSCREAAPVQAVRRGNNEAALQQLWHLCATPLVIARSKGSGPLAPFMFLLAHSPTPSAWRAPCCPFVCIMWPCNVLVDEGLFLGPESGSHLGGAGCDTAPCVSRLRPPFWVPENGPHSGSAFQDSKPIAGALQGASPAAKVHRMASPEPSLHGSGCSAVPASPVVVSSAARKRPVSQAEVEAFETRKLHATVAKIQANLSARGMTLSDDSLQLLFEIPAVQALQLIHGIDGPHVRHPAGLLAWKLRTCGGHRSSAQPLDALAAGDTPPRASFQPAAAAQAESPVNPVVLQPQPPIAPPAPTPQASSCVADARLPHVTPMHCPGCGEFGKAPRKDILGNAATESDSSRIGFSSSWGSHKCGASWMCMQLPQNFGTGMCLAAWLRRGGQAPGVHAEVPLSLLQGSAASADVLEHRASTLSPQQFPLRCFLCGHALAYLAFEETTHTNKLCAQWHCPRCPLTLVGSITVESEWNHFTAFWVSAAAR